MSHIWWQLPGPSRYIDSIISDVRSGMNVVLRISSHAAQGIREAVKSKVQETELWRWRHIDGAELQAVNASDLAEKLHQSLQCRVPSGVLASPTHLAHSLAEGDVVWVDNIGASHCDAWTKFMAQYQHACHARLEDRRGLFCIPLVGSLPMTPSPDTALSIRSWSGCISRLDQMIFLSRLLSSQFQSLIHHRVALAVATELMGADALLGVSLAAAGRALLTDPLQVLQQVGRGRNWSSETVRVRHKDSGVEDEIDGIRQLNSAALSLSGNEGQEEIRRRVWSGQVSVLYPFIEEQRVRMVRQVSGYIDLPVETTFGRIEAAIDLEVGELVHFLRGKKLPDRTWRKLLLMKEMRHTLAHLRPVSSDMLFSREFEELANGG